MFPLGLVGLLDDKLLIFLVKNTDTLPSELRVDPRLYLPVQELLAIAGYPEQSADTY